MSVRERLPLYSVLHFYNNGCDFTTKSQEKRYKNKEMTMECRASVLRGVYCIVRSKMYGAGYPEKKQWTCLWVSTRTAAMPPISWSMPTILGLVQVPITNGLSCTYMPSTTAHENVPEGERGGVHLCCRSHITIPVARLVLRVPWQSHQPGAN